MKKIAVHSLVLLLLVWAAAAKAQIPQPPQQTPQGTDPAYRIGPRDLLDIRVYEDAKLNGERRVSEAGVVNLPLLGDIPVGGKTTAEVGQALKRAQDLFIVPKQAPRGLPPHQCPPQVK